MRLLTGTSGFAYREWKGDFYPDKLPAGEMLPWYAARFPAVEINNTFYRMPAESVLQQWAGQVPDGFRFALKASQRITHRKRLREVGEEWEYFTRTAAVLGEKLGPVLVQLPPNLKLDAERLHAFLTLLRPEVRVALEFRHPSWLTDTVYQLLREYGAALCTAHGEQEETAPVLPTTSWGYVRLRNVEYTRDDLAAWAERLAGQPWSEAYVFFKHEDAGTGPRLAREFAGLWPGPLEASPQ